MKLSDLLTADQGLTIIEKLASIEARLTELEKRLENQENQVSNLTWKDITLATEIAKIYREEV